MRNGSNRTRWLLQITYFVLTTDNIQVLVYLLYQSLPMFWLYIAMPCPQMRGNLIGYRGQSTNAGHEKAVCREKNVGMNGTA